MSEKKEGREKVLEPRREERRTQLRESVRAAWHATALRRCLEWGLRLALAMALSTGRVLKGCSPFGLAFVGACGPGAGGFAALLGAVGGYLVSLGLDEAMRYTAGCILVFAVSFAFYDLAVYKKSWFMPLAAALLNALTNLVTIPPRFRTQPSRFLPLLMAEFALTLLCVYAFRTALSLFRQGKQATPSGAAREEVTFRQRACLILLAMAVLISLSGLKLAETVSVGRLLALWLALWAGYATGAGGGAAVGLCVGLAMDLAGQGPRIYALTFSLSGLSAGIFRKNGRFVTVLSCAVTGAVAALWSWEQADPMGTVVEVLLAGGLFLAAPRRFLDRLHALLAAEHPPFPAAWSAQTAQRRLLDTAAAFSHVFSSLKSAFSAKTADTDEDPAVIYDRAANRVCSSCSLRERCWQSQYQDTHDLLNAALPGLLTDRTAAPTSLPQRFRDRCVRLPSFAAAVNEELRSYLLRQQYAGQLGRSRQAVCRQYEQMAEVLEEAAAAMGSPYTLNALKTRRLSRFLAARDLRCDGVALTDPQGRLRLQITGRDAAALATPAAVAALSSALDAPLVLISQPTEENPQTLLRQREPLSALAGVAGRKKDGETVSGDACAWFKDDFGQLYLLLCDGMGTGREARRESELAIDLLEKFLKAGFSPESALKTLDQAFSLRLEEAMGFSTVDLLVLDLFSGAGTLYKLGSAPSYLKHGGTVKVLRGKGFPAGLEGRADVYPVRLDPGDCLVLLTDGVLEGEGLENGKETEGDGQGEDDRWLREVLVGFEGGSPAVLAEVIAGHTPSAADDKTALVLRVTLRSADDHPEEGKAAV